MKKILFSDVDGTIIDQNGLLHPQDKEAINQLRAQGHYMVLCTGRTKKEIQVLLNTYHFPYDYLILNNGSRIIDKDGNDLYKKEVSAQAGRKIIENCLNYQDYSLFFYDGIREISLAWINNKTHIYGDHGMVETDEYDFLEEYKKSSSFELICFNQNNEQIDQTIRIKEFVESQFKDELSAHLNTYFLDIVPANCSKGSGIKTLLSLLCEQVESYAVGDSYNDILMFDAVNHSYTFHRCLDEIKQHTDKQVDYVYQIIDDMLGG